MLFWVLHAFYTFVFVLVQRNSACFTWTGAVAIQSLLLLLLLEYIDTGSQRCCPNASSFWCLECRLRDRSLLTRMAGMALSVLDHSSERSPSNKIH